MHWEQKHNFEVYKFTKMPIKIRCNSFILWLLIKVTQNKKENDKKYFWCNLPHLSVLLVGRWAVLLFLSEMFPLLSFVSVFVFAFLLFSSFFLSLFITLTVLQKSVRSVLSLYFHHLSFHRSGRFLCHMFFRGLKWKYYYTIITCQSKSQSIVL